MVVVHPILLHVRDLLLLLKNFCFSLFCGITFRDLFHVVLPHEILFYTKRRRQKKKNKGFLILWHNFRFKQRFIENQINVGNLAYVRWQMSVKGDTWILTNAAVSVATEDVALIAITFIHFIMNVVAILITRIPIFTTTWNTENVMDTSKSSVSNTICTLSPNQINILSSSKARHYTSVFGYTLERGNKALDSVFI